MRRQSVDDISRNKLGSAKGTEAFTLIELLVVIAIVALLMGILLPTLARVREQARQQNCASRIRQHLIALNMYADDNNTKLPLPRSAFYWLQDVAISTANYMLGTGLTREIFYCPSNANHQKYNDLFWFWGNGAAVWNGRRFTGSDAGYLVSGYCYILDLVPPARRDRITPYEKDSMEKTWLRTTQAKSPAMREAVVDSIMAIHLTGASYGCDFAHIPGGIYNAYGIYDRTSHLKGEKDPIGGNVGFLDVHTEWRKFNPDMQGNVAVQRYGDCTAASPGFFW